MKYLNIILLLIVLFKDGHQESFEECWIYTLGATTSLKMTCGLDRNFLGSFNQTKKFSLFDIEKIIE